MLGGDPVGSATVVYVQRPLVTDRHGLEVAAS